MKNKIFVSIFLCFCAIGLFSCGNNNNVSLDLETATLNLEINEAKEIKYTLTDKSAKGVSFVSDDSAIADVSTQGVVTGVSSGTTKITVASVANPSVKKEVSVIVAKPEPTSVMIAGAKNIECSQEITLSATVFPANAVQTITWSSSNSNIITVSDSGKIKGIIPGKAKITATSVKAAIKSEVEIEVLAPKPESIIINGAKGIFAGEEITLSAVLTPDLADQSVTWLSSDETIASVSASGLVKGLKTGKVIISATSVAKNTLKAEVEINVTLIDATGITINGAKSLTVNEEVTLTAVVMPNNASQAVVWSLNDDTMGTISEAGVFKALKNGTVTITATSTTTPEVKKTVDIVITSSTPLSLYVDSSWSAKPIGAKFNHGDIELTFGTDAFASINKAVESLVNKGNNEVTIYVLPGLYDEEIIINLSYLKIIGPNASFDPYNGALYDEAIITKSISLATTTKVTDVIISGFTIKGNAQVKKGAKFELKNFEFSHNNMEEQNLSDAHFISFVSESFSGGVKNFVFSYNKMINDANNKVGYPINIAFYENVEISYNIIDRFGNDFRITNGNGELLIKNNRITNSGYRFFMILAPVDLKITITENHLETCVNAAIAIYSVSGGATVKNLNLEITFNTVKDMMNGIYLDFEYAANATVNSKINFNVFEKYRFNNPTINYHIYVISAHSHVFDFKYNYFDGGAPFNLPSDTASKIEYSPIYSDADAVLKPGETLTIEPTTSLDVDNPIDKLLLGESFQLNYSVGPSSAFDKSVIWNSSDPSVISVSNKGLLKALKIGTVTISATASGNRTLVFTFEVEVYTEPGIDIIYEGSAKGIYINEETLLRANIYPYDLKDSNVIWESSNPSVATIDADGLVKAVQTGRTTITCKLADDVAVINSFIITILAEVLDLEVEDFVDYNAMISGSIHKDVTAVGSFEYTTDILASVSYYAFNDLNIIESIIQTSKNNRPGIKKPLVPDVTLTNSSNVRWIVIHDTGNSNSTANALAHSNLLHNYSKDPNASTVSWHYTVDDKDIYHHIPDDEIAYHAGDGTATPGNGNNNGIGIESCINQGVDLYRVWQKTAKLTAYLLLKYNLPISAVKQHYDFSGKNCPQTLRNNNLYGEFMKMVEAELYLATNFADIKLSLISGNTEFLANNGRIINWPLLPTTINYTIVGKREDETIFTKDYTIYLPGKTIR